MPALLQIVLVGAIGDLGSAPWHDRALLRPAVLFLCRDAGETLAFLPVIEILNNDSRLQLVDSTSVPRAVALATTLNAAQRLSELPAAEVLTWQRLGIPNANDRRFLYRNATLSNGSLDLLLSQLQVRRLNVELPCHLLL